MKSLQIFMRTFAILIIIFATQIKEKKNQFHTFIRLIWDSKEQAYFQRTIHNFQETCSFTF